MAGTLLCFCQILLSDGRLLWLATKAARAEGDNKCFSPPPPVQLGHHGVAPHCDPMLAVMIFRFCTSATIRVATTSVGTPEQETGSSIVTSHLLQLTSDTDRVPVQCILQIAPPST